MPSLLIHLAVANQYLKRNPGKIRNVRAFREGSIAPDLNEDFSKILTAEAKNASHFYAGPDNVVQFDQFLAAHGADLGDDFWQGYFLHLITDQKFYHEDFVKELARAESLRDQVYFYTDYANSARWLLRRYKIDTTEEFFTKRVQFLTQNRSGRVGYLKRWKLRRFIDKMAWMDLAEFARRVWREAED